MKAHTQTFKSGWVGVSLVLQTHEVDALISRLVELKSGTIGHFHFRNNEFSKEPGLADIEISLASGEQDDNLIIE